MSDFSMKALTEIARAISATSRPFTDLIVHQDKPVMMMTPSGAEEWETHGPVSKDQLEELFGTLEPKWKTLMDKGALDRGFSIGSYRVRVNMMRYGGSAPAQKLGAVMRFFPTSIPKLNELGLGREVVDLASQPRGLVIVTGPIKSGKTTTIASILDHLNNSTRGHIVTTEDPIEIVHLQRNCVVTQREVGTDVESFARGAKDALRERPSCYMIGEVRDRETADLLFSFAEAGLLVIATMHSASPEQAISRLLKFFPDEMESRADTLARSLVGIIAQVLIPRADNQNWVLASEVLRNDDKFMAMIEKMNYGELRRRMNSGGTELSNCYTMASSLAKLVVNKQVTRDAAELASFDRMALQGALLRAGIK